MNTALRIGLLASLASIFAVGAYAGDAEECLDCHVPEEDWVGMSMEEIMASAKDASIKRHKDNKSLSDDELKAILADLLPK